MHDSVAMSTNDDPSIEALVYRMGSIARRLIKKGHAVPRRDEIITRVKGDGYSNELGLDLVTAKVQDFERGIQRQIRAEKTKYRERYDREEPERQVRREQLKKVMAASLKRRAIEKPAVTPDNPPQMEDKNTWESEPYYATSEAHGSQNRDLESQCASLAVQAAQKVTSVKKRQVHSDRDGLADISKPFPPGSEPQPNFSVQYESPKAQIVTSMVEMHVGSERDELAEVSMPPQPNFEPRPNISEQCESLEARLAALEFSLKSLTARFESRYKGPYSQTIDRPYILPMMNVPTPRSLHTSLVQSDLDGYSSAPPSLGSCSSWGPPSTVMSESSGTSPQSNCSIPQRKRLLQRLKLTTHA